MNSMSKLRLNENSSNFRETAGLLTGTYQNRLWQCRLQVLCHGGPARVEFDWRVAVDREDRCHDVAGFYHTHPAGHLRPSRRDIQTMRAWCDCLAKPLLCVIGTLVRGEARIFGYVFRNYRSRGRKTVMIAHNRNNMCFKE